MPRALLAVMTTLLVTATAVPLSAQSPAPDLRGVSVLPGADSPYRSASGQVLELGEVAPGTLLEDEVVLFNSSDQERSVRLYPVDAAPALGGGFSYGSRDERPSQVGAWTSLSLQEVTLPPQGRRALTVTVRVPASAAGGDYRGGVVADPVVAGAGAVSITTRYAMPVVLRVAGAPAGTTPGRGRPDGTLRLDDVRLRTDGDTVCAVVTYGNDSQEVVDPVALVTVDPLLGGDRRRQVTGAGAVAPGQSREVELPCLRRPLGPAQLEVRLESPRGTASEQVSAAWLPWPLRLALLALLLLVAALLFQLLRGRRRRGEQPPAAERARE